MNKTVLITGAAKGIGRQIAIDFAKEGYNVCINYNKSEKQANELVQQLISQNYNVICYKCDITSREEVNEMISYVLSNFGSIDVLVNNAGIAQYKLFTDISESDLNTMINTSLVGTFNVTQEVLKKYMINNKNGNIINISSIWGQVGASCEVHYSMVKSGIIGFTKALAKELSLSNIRVNAITPGVIQTDMISNFNEEELNEICKDIPLNRIGKPEDVSGLVLFLASSKADYITGQVISPNGGMVI